MPEHFPPVERQTDWQVIRLPERRNYIQNDVLLCRSTNTWQAAPAADLSTGKNTHGDGSYRLTFYVLFIFGGKAAEIPCATPSSPVEVLAAVMWIDDATREHICGGLPRAEPLWA